MLRRRTTIFSEAKPERLSEPERDRAAARRKGGVDIIVVASRGNNDIRFIEQNQLNFRLYIICFHFISFLWIKKCDHRSSRTKNANSDSRQTKINDTENTMHKLSESTFYHYSLICAKNQKGVTHYNKKAFSF